MKKFWLVLFLLIFSCGALFAEEEITTITIMNARQTSYKKAEDTGNDTIILEGSVILSVQKGNSTTEIKADKITYDRKTEMLFAEGNVAIETTGSGSSGGEKTTATSLLMNTSTLEGVFDGGRVVQTQSDALNLPSGSTLIVFADLFGKGSGNVISFKNSSLTFCDDENPHWHIDATRTWLLPGGEFAFFNALLYVGVVPVLYFPAFYYPKDELVFNPVFSYRKREGYSIQTTTYVYGRKPLDTTSNSTSSSDDSSSQSAESLKAIYNFVRPSTLKEQKLEGIVLHNLDEDYTGDTSTYLKILADYYSNLGYMVGFDGSFQPSKKYLTKLNVGIDFGISNTIFRANNNYYPFSSLGNKFKDSSTFLGITMPFRYKANIELTLSKPFSLTLSLPIYSDPFFAFDFLTHRSETMDWISYFLDNNGKNSTTDETPTEISSFEWKLATSFSPTIPSFLNPYISSFSFNLTSSVNISSMQTSEFDNDIQDREWESYTPSKRFYYPSLVTPANFNVSMSGTLFSWPIKKTVKTQNSTSYAITLNKPDAFKTQKELEDIQKKVTEEKTEESDDDDDEIDEEEKTDNEENTETELFKYINPTIDYSVETAKEIAQTVNYSLKYSVAANITNQLAYSSSALKKSEDFDWGNIRSYMYTIKVPTTLTSSFSYGQNLISVDNSISFSPVFQDHPYVSTDNNKGGYSDSELQTLRVADYNAENRDIFNTNKVTIRPLTNVTLLSDSNVTWNSNIKLFRRKFIGTADEPEWENYSVDWDDSDSITVNSLSATISMKELDSKFKQDLSFTMIMPPLLREYNASLNLTFPYVTSTFSTGIQETTKDNVSSDEKWKKSPFKQTLTVSLFNSKLTFNESFSYNLEDKNAETLSLSTSWYGLNLQYSMSYTTGYDFNNGWKVRTEKEFLPYSLSFSYKTPSKTFYKWFNRISIAPSLNTSIVADLLRPTNSYFIFSPALTFKINEFFDITFSSTSRNAVLYWYFHEGLYDEWGGFPGNMFKDLIDSFRFDDRSKREGSGFKLKSLNMSISHALHDWKFNMTLKIEPRLLSENGTRYYDFNPYLTIGIVWNPMESMKTSIVDEYGEWKLE